MTAHPGTRRIGRMAPWQRLLTHALLGASALSGLGWFIGLDLLGLPPPRLKPWWLSHGVAGIASMLAIGAALPVHVVATWRHGRNRVWGALTLVVLSIVAATALGLLYGPESTREAMHWLHVILGVGATAAFAWHVVRGKRAAATRERPGHARP